MAIDRGQGNTSSGDAIRYDADYITVDDLGSYFSGTDVEAVLQEIGAGTATITGFAKYADTTANFTGTLQNGGSNVVVDSDIGSTVQGYDAGLAYLDGLDFTNEATFKAGVNLEIGTDVQAYDAELAALAGLTSAANKVPYFTGSGTAGVLDFIDDDTMATASATSVASSESVKAYVDSTTSGVTLGTETSVGTGNTVTYAGIPAGTKRITILWEGVSSGSANSEIAVRIGDSGGVETSGYLSQSDGPATTDRLSDTVQWLMCELDGAASVSNSGRIIMELKDATNFTWVASWAAEGVSQTTSADTTWVGTGVKSLSAELTQVQLRLNGTDNFDAGDFNIQYE